MTRHLALPAIIGLSLLLVAGAGSAVRVGSASLVVSEVYGAGGNAGATYANDFVELRNAGAAPVALAGWSVQYASASGSSWAVTALPSVTLAAHQYLLVQEASGGASGAPLPTADATGTIAMAAAAGKVAVVSATTALTGTCPPGAVDLVGYGTATCFEGAAAAPAPSNVLSDQRLNHGLTDTDDNAADFQALAPDPQNASSPTAVRLVGLRATRTGSVVVLRWSTGTDAGALGFELSRDGVRLERGLIAATGGTAGARYRFRDGAAPPRSRYRLLLVRQDGSRAWLGSVRA
jgi:predicted extracellular nuclease